MDSWDRRIKLEAKRFISGWDWDLVYHTWSRRFHDFNVNLTPLFKEIRVYDPKYPIGQKKILSWCPVDSIIEFHINFQRYLERYPGTVGPTYNWLQGELETLEYLWAYKGEEDKIAAILISAPLFLD